MIIFQLNFNHNQFRHVSYFKGKIAAIIAFFLVFQAADLKGQCTVDINNPGTKLCLNATATIDATVSSDATPCTYQWQTSNDSLAWSDISGQTGTGFNIPSAIASTKYYRVKVVSSGSCGTLYSVGRKITVGSFPGCDCLPQSCSSFSKLVFNTNSKIANPTGMVGDKWRFTNVLTGYDAIVEITNAHNVDSLNSIDNTAVNIDDWCPEIYMNFLSGQDSYLDWRITVVTAGTNTPANLPSSSRVSSYDVDGNANYREIHGHINTNGYVVNDPTELSIASEPPFSMVLGSTLEHASISTHPEVKATFYYPGQNNIFNIRLGVRTVTGGSTGFRQFAVSFDPCISYSKPDITPLTPEIAGLNATCVGAANQTYSTTQTFVSYTWAITGGTIVSGQSTKNISVDWTTTGNQTVSVTTTDANGCTSNAVYSVSISADPSVNITGTATICAGGTTVLTANVTGGSGSTSYQWQQYIANSWTNIGTNSTTYTATALPSNTVYRVLITQTGSGCGNTSGNFTVTVVATPSVSVSATNTTICTGNTTTLNASISNGTGTTSYQWQQYILSSWTNVGSNSATHTTSALATNTDFRVIITQTGNGCGTATAAPTTITVVNNVAATVSVNNALVCIGGNALISASVSGGTSSKTYQWQSSPDDFTWQNILGATNPTYAARTDTAGIKFYRVVLSSSGFGCVNGTSASTSVEVVPDPSIATQPEGFIECNSGNKTLSVIATGGSTLTYQWQKSTDSTSWANIDTATTNTYRPSSATLNKTFYRVIVKSASSGCDSIKSAAAAVEIVTKPVINITVSTNTLCTGASATLGAQMIDLSASCNLQWQSKNGSGNWNDLSGETKPIYTTPALNSTVKYRVTLLCSGSGCCN